MTGTQAVCGAAASYEAELLTMADALHLAREQPPNSFHYERIVQIQSQNVPDLAEVGYEMSEERFVVKPRNGHPRMRRVEDFTKQFFEDVVAKHFG